MSVLIVGATGMTGRLVVGQLLEEGHQVRAIVRSRERFSEYVGNHSNLSVTEASLLDLSAAELASHTRDCEAVVSCLGHVLSFKGMFGEPKRLCTEATQRLIEAINENRPPQGVKFILMNTVGVANPKLNETRPWSERAVLALLRRAIPPHRDNETAAQFLDQMIREQYPSIEWCAVRPDSLIDEDVSAYDIEPSPITGLFSGRPTSRANVAHFILDLIENEVLWRSWKFRMPVIMNSIAVSSS